jgi:hypothetical protein
MVTFSTCKGAKSCSDFCGGVYFNTPEIGDATCGCYDPNVLSAIMGARGYDGRAVKMLDVGGVGAGKPQLGML